MVDVKHLAELSKIEYDEKLQELEKDFDAILDFVSKVKELDLDLEPKLGDVYNVFREDEAKERFDIDKKELVEQAPKHKDGYVLVKKVIKRD